jgi:hypothetical protein
VKICTILYSFHSICKTKFVRCVYRNVSNVLIFMKIDLVQSVIYISTERDFSAPSSPAPPLCMILVKFVARGLHVMLLRIGGFRENWLQKSHNFLRVSNYVCACHETVWHFQRKERLVKFCVSCHGRKCVRSYLKKSPTKVDWSVSISIVNLNGQDFNIFL